MTLPERAARLRCRLADNWLFGHWTVLRTAGKLCALKAPWWPTLFSERYRRGVTVIPLGFGWRITIRTIDAGPKERIHD